MLDDLDSVMHRMGRLMSARHAEFQQASGMATPHYMVLKTLSLCGPQRVSDLAAMLGVKSPAASMLVQQLEHDALITRSHADHDNRVVIIAMTPRGEERLAGSEVFRRQLLRSMTADLSGEELRALARILSTITDTVARDT